MAKIDLDELERLEKAATPAGELHVLRYDHGGGRAFAESADARTLVADFFDVENRELFLAARNALPALIAELRELREPPSPPEGQPR